MAINPFSTDYKSPESSNTTNNNYLKFSTEGSYVFRILTPKTQVLTYYRGFTTPEDGKSKKFIIKDDGSGIFPKIPEGIELKTFTRIDQKTGKATQSKPISLVWAFKVFNQDSKKVQIWEVSQKSIQTVLTSIAGGKLKNDWSKFDIQITKTGEKTNTEYSLIAGDTAELTPADLKIIDNTPVDIMLLETGEDPFSPTNKITTAIINTFSESVYNKFKSE